MAFVLYLNNNLLGIFDNENALNTFIKGGIQNNFFKNENIRTEQYIMNSCYKITQSDLFKKYKKQFNSIYKYEDKDKR